MKLKLVRFHTSPVDTLGLLYINDVFACFTIEDAHRVVKVMNETRIPEGTYPVALKMSPRFTPRYGHKMLVINDVPGFKGILIHRGNTALDSSGCILVGDIAQYDPNGASAIGRSTAAYDRIYPIISEAVKQHYVTLEIV